MPPAEGSVVHASYEQFFKFISLIGNLFLIILGSLKAMTSNSIFLSLMRYSRSSIFLGRENVLIWKRHKTPLWLSLLRVWITSIL